MCSVRRGHAEPKDGKPRLSTICPFAAKGTIAVLGQGIGIVADTTPSSVVVPGRKATGSSRSVLPAIGSRFENPKRGPPSVLL